MAEHIALKKAWGTLTETWVPYDVRDQVVIEIIRDLPANLFATEGDHGCAFPSPRCLAHERETK
jgi:hypothetical protein